MKSAKSSMYELLAKSEKKINGRTAVTVPGYSAVKSYVAVDAENPPTNAFDESKTYQLESSPERGSYDESKCETDLRRENASEPLSPGQVAVIQRLQYQEQALKEQTVAVQQMLQQLENLFKSSEGTPADLRYYSAQARILQEMANEKFGDIDPQAVSDFIDSRSILLPSQVGLLKFREELRDVSQRRKIQHSNTEDVIFSMKDKAFKEARRSVSREASDSFFMHRRGWIFLRRLFIASKISKALRGIVDKRRHQVLRRALNKIRGKALLSIKFHVRSYLKILGLGWMRFKSKCLRKVHYHMQIERGNDMASYIIKKRISQFFRKVLVRSRMRRMITMQAVMHRETAVMRRALQVLGSKTHIRRRLMAQKSHKVHKDIRLALAALKKNARYKGLQKLAFVVWYENVARAALAALMGRGNAPRIGSASRNANAASSHALALEKSAQEHFDHRIISEFLAVWTWATAVSRKRKMKVAISRMSRLLRHGKPALAAFKSQLKYRTKRKLSQLKLQTSNSVKLRNCLHAWRAYVVTVTELRIPVKVGKVEHKLRSVSLAILRLKSFSVLARSLSSKSLKAAQRRKLRRFLYAFERLRMYGKTSRCLASTVQAAKLSRAIDSSKTFMSVLLGLLRRRHRLRRVIVSTDMAMLHSAIMRLRNRAALRLLRKGRQATKTVERKKLSGGFEVLSNLIMQRSSLRRKLRAASKAALQSRGRVFLALWRGRLDDEFQQRMAEKVAGRSHNIGLLRAGVKQWLEWVKRALFDANNPKAAVHNPPLCQARIRGFFGRWLDHKARFEEDWSIGKLGSKYFKHRGLGLALSRLRQRRLARLEEDQIMAEYRRNVQRRLLLRVAIRHLLAVAGARKEGKADMQLTLRSRRTSSSAMRGWAEFAAKRSKAHRREESSSEMRSLMLKLKVVACWSNISRRWADRRHALKLAIAKRSSKLGRSTAGIWKKFARFRRQRRLSQRKARLVLQRKYWAVYIVAYVAKRERSKLRAAELRRAKGHWATWMSRTGWAMWKAGLQRLRDYKLLKSRASKFSFSRLRLLRAVFAGFKAVYEEGAEPERRGLRVWSLKKLRLAFTCLHETHHLRPKSLKRATRHQATQLLRWCWQEWEFSRNRVETMKYLVSLGKKQFAGFTRRLIFRLLRVTTQNRAYLRRSLVRAKAVMRKNGTKRAMKAWAKLVWESKNEIKSGHKKEVRMAKAKRRKSAGQFQHVRGFQKVLNALLANADRRQALKRRFAAARETVQALTSLRALREILNLIRLQKAQREKEVSIERYWESKQVADALTRFRQSADRMLALKSAGQSHLQRVLVDAMKAWKRHAPPLPFRSIQRGVKSSRGSAGGGPKRPKRAASARHSVAASAAVAGSLIPKDALKLHLDQNHHHHHASSPASSARSTTSVATIKSVLTPRRPPDSALASALGKKGSGGKSKSIAFATPLLCAPQPLTLTGDFRSSRQLEALQLAEHVRPWWLSRLLLKKLRGRSAVRAGHKLIIEDCRFAKIANALRLLGHLRQQTMKRRQHLADMQRVYVHFHVKHAMSTLQLHQRMKQCYRVLQKKMLRKSFASWVHKKQTRIKLQVVVKAMMMNYHLAEEICAFREWKHDCRVEAKVEQQTKKRIARLAATTVKHWLTWRWRRVKRKMWFLRGRDYRLERQKRAVITSILAYLDTKYKTAEKLVAADRYAKAYCCRAVLHNLLFFRRNRIAQNFKVKKAFGNVVAALRLNKVVCRFSKAMIAVGTKTILQKLFKQWRMHLIKYKRFLFSSVELRKSKLEAIAYWRAAFWMHSTYRFLACHYRLRRHQRQWMETASYHQEQFSLRRALRRLFLLRRSRRRSRLHVHVMDTALVACRAKKAFHRLDVNAGGKWANVQKIRLMAVHARQAALIRGMRALRLRGTEKTLKIR